MSIPAVSILVPVYNVERYLKRCVDSVLTQNFQDWEMILVDDGSTDNSSHECDLFSQNESRISVVHKENGGLPSARLAGFKLAKGNYIVFLDSDDWLLENALTTLFSAIEEGYDIVKARPMRTDGEKRWRETYAINEGELLSMMDYGEKIIQNDIHPYLHSGIYRRSLFSEKVFEPIVRTGISFGEDWFTNVMIIDKVRKVKIIDTCVYAYYVNSQSLVGTTTISSKTADAADSFLYDYLSSVDPHLSEIAFCKNYLGALNDLFKPEAKFEWKNYQMVRLFFYTHPTYRKRAISKYLYFINYPILFYLYSSIYKYLYKSIKLKGKLRKKV